MADLFDQASERENMDREAAIKRQLQTTQQRLRPEGYCLTCFQDFPHSDTKRLFCNAACANNHRAR